MLVVAISIAMCAVAEAKPWRAERMQAIGAIDDEVIAEREARRYLATHLPAGTSIGDFELVANHHDGALRTIAFQQRWRGLRVVDATIALVFGRGSAGDRLFAIKSRAAANVDAPIAPRHRDLGRVEAWMQRETKLRVRVRATGELVVVQHTGGFVIAELIEAHAIDSVDRWNVYVAADGTPIRRDELVMDATATLKFNAGVRHARGTRQDFEASRASVTVNGASGAASATGVITWGGTPTATIMPSTTGLYVRVLNQAGPNATTTFTNVQDGGTMIWDLSADPLGDAQLSTYIYANRAKARARLINPAISGWLDNVLNVYVNKAPDCNGRWDGTAVHLYQGTSLCENSGRVADVVYHELAHGVHEFSIIQGAGAFTSRLSEGLSDFFTANITEDPVFARGFYLADDGALRDIDPVGFERVFPDDIDDFDDHVSGLIIAGALWDLRKTLISQLGYSAGVARVEKIFTGIMQRADDIETTFDAALVADDDNADLLDGTPNYCAIANAFGRHGLVEGYETTTVSLPRVDGLRVSIDAHTPSNATCSAPAVTHVYVVWKAGDGVASVFELTKDGETWSGEIPEQPTGTVISYSVEVQLDDGTSQVFPNNPADPLYQLMVGVPSQIWCERMDADPMWTQTSTEGLGWEWAPPVVSGTSDDPPYAKTGNGVLGTDVTGDGLYRDNQAISILTPFTDVSRYQHVHLQYWRWLTVEDRRYDQAAILANGEPVWHNAFSPTGTLDHVDREWRFHDIDVTPFVRDGTMQITWALATDGSKGLGGWTLDDVCLVGLDHIGRCGDSIIEQGEQCDDGGLDNGDGCSDRCLFEPYAGGGGCSASGGGSAGGASYFVIAVFVFWRRRSRNMPSRSVSERMP